MKEYSHTQTGYGLLITYSVVIVFIGFLMIVTHFKPVALAGLIIMLIALGLFGTLTVKVSEQMINLQFGLGVIRKRFLLKDIESYQVVKNPWYYGWGIRFTPRGWLFNVSGCSAIELHMKHGRNYRIGMDDPAGLIQVLDEVLPKKMVNSELSMVNGE